MSEGRMGFIKRRVLVTRKDGVKQHYWKWISEDEENRITMIEYTFNYIPTRGDNRPSSQRDWEVKITVPETVSREMARYYADESLEYEMNMGDGMVETANVLSRQGADIIEDVSPEDVYMRYFIMDKKRPQYSYRGDIEDIELE